jgi:squalene cyclase
MIQPIEPDSVRRAIDRGIAFLAEGVSRRTDGLWHDYLRPDGSAGSNVWASAFIAAKVGDIPAARRLAASVVTALLERQRPRGGWGYDDHLLEDADSTAWVLLAAKSAGVHLSRSVVIPALQFVLSHQRPSGGFVTYGPEGLELFGDIAGRDGWFTPQPCVSAAAVAALTSYATPDLPALSEAVAFVEQAAVAGLWGAYWWHGPMYGTHHAVAALTKVGRLPRAQARATASAIVVRRNADGGWDGMHPRRSLVFPTALALSTLVELQADQQSFSASAGLLMAHQHTDGSFRASAELLVPGGDGPTTMTMVDRGYFTTACALKALHQYVEHQASCPQ